MNSKAPNFPPPDDYLDEEVERAWLRHETIRRFQLEEEFYKRRKLVSPFQIVREGVKFYWKLYIESLFTYEDLLSHLKRQTTPDINRVWWTMDKNERIWYRLDNGVWLPVDPPFNLTNPAFDFEELDYWGRVMRMDAGRIDDRWRVDNTFQKSEVAQPPVNQRFTKKEIADLVKKLVDDSGRVIQEKHEVEDTLEKFLRGIIPNQ